MVLVIILDTVALGPRDTACFFFSMFTPKGCIPPLIRPAVVPVRDSRIVSPSFLQPTESWYQAPCGFLLRLFPFLPVGATCY